VRIKIGSRKSDLARIQAYTVGEALNALGCETEYFFKESLGDKNLTSPLWQMPEKGVFTEDFVNDLEHGQIDIVVHSWKDLPLEERELTEIVATLPRADKRDVLLFRKENFQEVSKVKKIRVLTSSPRRSYNLNPFFKEALPFSTEEMVFEPVRGNVPTRIRKLFEGDCDGLVLAKAALDRILAAKGDEFADVKRTVAEFLKKSLIMILPLERNPTAPAQGALAIEIRKDRNDLREILQKLNCKETFQAVSKERSLLKSYGGGCHQKVGISVRVFPFGEMTYTRALKDSGIAVDTMDFIPKEKFEKVRKESVFPSENDESFFSREAIQVEIPQGPLFVTKSDALPESYHPQVNQLVWTSGWESWKKLAKRGIWVSGCFESLGEVDTENSFSLWPQERWPQSWTKLTHNEGYKENMKVVGTYKLSPKEKSPKLEGKTHFFWMSSSSFLRALEVEPERIKSGQHNCGPGNTFAVISGHVPVRIWPSFAIWKKMVIL
jgi:hydroxymethylbilane synthase